MKINHILSIKIDPISSLPWSKLQNKEKQIRDLGQIFKEPPPCNPVKEITFVSVIKSALTSLMTRPSGHHAVLYKEL